MYKITKLIHFTKAANESSRQRFADNLRAASSTVRAHRALIEPTLPGVRNGGDLLVHLQFDSEDQWRAAEPALQAHEDRALVAHIDGAEYQGSRSHHSETRCDGGVYRTLLLRVSPDADAGAVEQFETDLLRMPQYVDTIRSWQLSRVSRAEGTSQWTHVWEQEFAGLDGLTGPYLAHPIHWAHVDRWFDPECPEVIVRDRVCHSFCSFANSVLEPSEMEANQ